MADGLQIGGVPYRVGARLVTGLDEAPGVRLRLEPPSELAGALRDGRLDAALVSSIEAFRQPGHVALPDLGIASDGDVRSVRLFLRTDPGAVRSLALDRSSETSRALSQILLRKRFGATLERVFDIPPTTTPDAVDADAVLLIGDPCMAADPGGRATLDLGGAWRAWKDLPFVFAIWLLPEQRAVAAGTATQDDERLLRVADLLRKAWQRGVAENVSDGTGGSIRYQLGAADMAALRIFKEEALALGLCEPGVEPGWLGQ